MKNNKSRKPKLLYIMAGGSTIPNEKAHSVQIMKMCEAFTRMGLEVELFTPDIRIDRKLENVDPFKYYGIEDRFKITRIPCLDLGSVYKHKYVKKLFYVQAFFYAFMATFYALRRNSDIIYTRDFYTALILITLGKRDNIVYEIHEFPRGYIRKFLELQMAEKIHCVFISNTLKSLFEQHVHGKFLVAPDGVDLGMFERTDSKGETIKKLFGVHSFKLVGYIGQLSSRGVKKGVDDLIKSMKYVDGVCVIVGGHDAEVKKYKDKVTEKGLGDKIIFTGRVPHSDIPDYLSIFDACVLPFPQEAYTNLRFLSPLKMFEYMASKKPIVATDLPTIREILNEDNAVLVKPSDPKDLADGIRRVLEDAEFARKIAKKAYEDVQQYTWKKRAEGILKFVGKNHV